MQNSIADSSHQLLADLIRAYDLTDFKVTDKAIVNTINGSDFLFKGLHRNEQSVKSTEGIDIAWVEEAQSITESSIEVLTPTVRKEGSQIIYTYNRLEEEDPVHKRLVIEGRPNTLLINVNYDIALKYGMMPDVIRLEMEDDKARRPDLYKHKWLGEPLMLLESRVYKGWQQIDEVPHGAKLVRRWLDFGYSNDPTSCGNVYEYDGGYILDELVYQTGLMNHQIASIILQDEDISGKTLTIADSSEPKSIDEIKMAGVTILPSVKGADSVNFGIKVVQAEKIWVTRRSLNTWKEYLNYQWMTDKDDAILPVPMDVYNHSMDGIRYTITSLKHTKPASLVVNRPSYAGYNQRKY
jgi:phage terminase large subunit